SPTIPTPLHDALPIYKRARRERVLKEIRRRFKDGNLKDYLLGVGEQVRKLTRCLDQIAVQAAAHCPNDKLRTSLTTDVTEVLDRSEEHTSELQSLADL